MDMKTSEELDAEADIVTAALSAAVRGLLDAGLEEASLVTALADALGVMMAAAPRHMADSLAASIQAQVLAQRAATWAEIDAAATVQ